ncbi:MAG TPA: prepilin peptidase [Candidatus Nanoarchaeia archaeon]
MIHFLLLLFFIFGLAVGSFLNVIAYRSIHGGSIFFDHSRCPDCKHGLAPADLAPIASFLWLRGRCRYCGAKISAQYPLVEAATGLLFTFTFYYWAANVSSVNFLGWLQLIYLLFVVSTLIVLFITDLKDGLLPNSVVLPAIGVVGAYKLILLLLNFDLASVFLIDIAAAAVAALAFFAIVYVSGEKAMGGGDAKLVFLIGVAVGWPSVLVAIFLGFLTGAFVAVMLMLIGRKRFGQTVPFGPFLTIGAFIAAFWGQALIDLYLRTITG